MCKVSIIVPVYNGEKYIRKAIDSLLCQELKDIEIIVINDGSTDRSEEIINQMANVDAYHRIKIITQQNMGVSVARNKGIELARGEYITFVDADDTLENTLMDLYRKAKETDADILFFGKKILGRTEKLSTIPKQYEGEQGPKIIELLIRQRLIGGMAWGKLYKKQIIKQVSFPSGIYPHEDGLFSIMVVGISQRFYVSCLASYCYLQQEASVIHSYRNYRTKNAINIYKFCENNFLHNIQFKTNVSVMISDVCVLAFIDALVNEFLLHAPCGVKSKYKNIKELCGRQEFQKAFSFAHRGGYLTWKRGVLYFCVKARCYAIVGCLCWLFAKVRVYNSI